MRLNDKIREIIKACELYTDWMTVNYRERYDILDRGFLFNHESSFRILKLLTRKFTGSVDTIKQGKLNALELGNVEYAFIGDSRLNFLEKDVALQEEQTLLKNNPGIYFPAEVEMLIANSANAKDQLDWRLNAMLEQLCQRMVQADFGHNTKELSF